MRIYVEAYRADDSQILGNLDGQTAFVCVHDHKRTAHYRALKDGTMRASREVAYWRIVTGGGRVLEIIPRTIVKRGGR